MKTKMKLNARETLFPTSDELDARDRERAAFDALEAALAKPDDEILAIMVVLRSLENFGARLRAEAEAARCTEPLSGGEHDLFVRKNAAGRAEFRCACGYKELVNP